MVDAILIFKDAYCLHYTGAPPDLLFISSQGALVRLPHDLEFYV